MLGAASRTPRLRRGHGAEHIVDDSKAIAALAALAQETRLQVFRALIKVGPEGLPAGSLSADLKVPAPTLSFHLQQLVHAGLVTKRRVSRSLIYAIDTDGMNGFMSYLVEDCCGGRPELCMPSTAAKAACDGLSRD